MDNSTIKHLIGHGPDSTVMETTYQHLSDDDYIAKAERAMGLREEQEVSPLTPDVCPTCGNHLGSDAKACEGCGAIFTPDAKAAEEQIDEDLWESKGKADTDEEQSAVDELKQLLDENPELKAELME
jgi:methionyl-tRNA synthetase